MSIPSSPILDFEKAQAVYAYGRDPLDMKNYRDELERQAQAAVSPLLAEIERLKGDLEGLVREAAEDVDVWRARHAAAEVEAQKLREKSVQDDAWFEHSCVQRIELAEANAGLKVRVTTLEVALKELLEAASSVIHPSVENNTWLRNKLASARKALGGS